MLQLYVGNKNYSSWSMRPWVLMKQAGIEFEERMVRFDSFEAGSEFKKTVLAVNPLGKVPILVHDGLPVSDTLAICEYLAETFLEKKLWPEDKTLRAAARSACAEMHAGFSALRSHCPMNIEADLSLQGRIVWRDQAGVREDLARIVDLWRGLLKASGGPMLFGDFGIVDAYFAPVASRIRTYALPVPDDVAAYVDCLHELPGIRAWTEAARAEHDFVPMDEPYRDSR
ncbi:MAG: glutathione S-transferase family protein [Janthinobacterium lividum]